eukprot:4833075-Pleurochrysis_carterae.AAC.2
MSAHAHELRLYLLDGRPQTLVAPVSEERLAQQRPRRALASGAQVAQPTTAACPACAHRAR